jgi:3-deoxy-D-arabino-heptulosonate 7-phosphate (DAHP) synthase
MPMTQALKSHEHPRTSRAEVAGYAADMLASLRRLSEANGMPLLAHLADLARIEAVRNSKAD